MFGLPRVNFFVVIVTFVLKHFCCLTGVIGLWSKEVMYAQGANYVHSHRFTDPSGASDPGVTTWLPVYEVPTGNSLMDVKKGKY